MGGSYNGSFGTRKELTAAVVEAAQATLVHHCHRQPQQTQRQTATEVRASRSIKAFIAMQFEVLGPAIGDSPTGFSQ